MIAELPDRQTSAAARRPRNLAEIHERICAAAALPLSRATTIPAAAYTSDEQFAWEVAHLLRGGWQAVAHVSQIPNPGDYLALDLVGEPLVVVRGKDAEVRVLSRVCPHRAMDILSGAEPCGQRRTLLCPYHAWSFDLDGRLKACPEMQQAEGFERGDFSLESFRKEISNGFVFVNLDGEAPPLAEGLEEMAEDVAAFRLEEMKLIITREWECAFDWKVLVENFMESYHHLGIHHQTLQPSMPARTTWTEQERRHYLRAHLPYKEAVRVALAEGETTTPLVPDLDDLRRNEWGLFLVAPSFLLATAHDRVIWYRLQPLGAGRLRLLTTVLVPAATVADPRFAAIKEQMTDELTAFHLEDMEVCIGVQRGLASAAWRPGRLSHLEMPVWLFHRYLAARIRGEWPTDDGNIAPSQEPA
jgi:phenylpropionate dioxygenase-like ring-hydroxylating dioxygenase large terminal subunit